MCVCVEVLSVQPQAPMSPQPMAMQPSRSNRRILCLPSREHGITQLAPLCSQTIKGEGERGRVFTATIKLHAFVGKTVRCGICTVQPSLHTSEYNRTPRQAQAVTAPWGKQLSEECSFHLMLYLPGHCWRETVSRSHSGMARVPSDVSPRCALGSVF